MSRMPAEALGADQNTAPTSISDQGVLYFPLLAYYLALLINALFDTDHAVITPAQILIIFAPEHYIVFIIPGSEI